MSKTFTLLALLAVAYVLNPPGSHAQNRAVISTADLTRRVTARNIHSRNLKLAAELQRQQKVLQNIAARYEEVSTYDLTPLLKYPYVWSALRENRSRVASPNVRLSTSESRVFKKAYDLLEEDTLMSFLDHQISILNEALELDEAQLAEMQKTLTMDLSNKRALLSNATIGAADFRRRLDQISDATEKRILAILFPEQRKMFDRQLMFERNRLIG